MIIAVHQPNYFPWLGYFQKIHDCDVFVFLDHVALPQGRSYTQRVQILTQSEPRWLTVPILKSGRSGQTINEVEYNPTENWRRIHKRTLEMSFGTHPHFDEVYPVAESLLEDEELSLADLNVETAKTFARHLGIECDFERSCQLVLPEVQKNGLLISITKAVGGDVYLHGAGAEDYQRRALFQKAGLELRGLDFEHPVYPQRGSEEFVPGLSILDPLFNLGFDRTGELLAGGSKP